MVGIQVLLLPAERRKLGSFGISLPRAISLLSVSGCTPLAAVVFPDGEPPFKKCPRDSKLTPNRPSQQFGQYVMLFAGQVLGLVQEERAVEP